MHSQPVHALDLLELPNTCPTLGDPQGTVITLEDQDADLPWYGGLGVRSAACGFQTRAFPIVAARPIDLGRRVARATQGLPRPIVLAGHGIGALLALRFARWGDVAAAGVIAAAPPAVISQDLGFDGLVEQARSGNPGIPTLVLHASHPSPVAEQEVSSFLQRLSGVAA